MADKPVTFDDSQLREFTERIGAWPREAMESGRVALEKSMRRTLQRIVRERLSGQALRSRSGTLRRSGISAATVNGHELTGLIRFGVHYARALEYGADIKPGAGKRFLTIPLTSAMTDVGVARGPIRSFPNIVFRRVKTPFVDPWSGKTIPAGALVAFQQARQGQRKAAGSVFDRKIGRQFTKIGYESADPLGDRVKTGELVPLFWLVRHARIKGRGFVRTQLSADRAQITADVIVAMRKGMRVKA